MSTPPGDLLRTPLYVACLLLGGRRCLVVGAGRIGLEKIEGLLACRADVTVVAVDAEPEVEALAREGSIALERREYRPSDVDGAFLVLAATSDTASNRAVFADAEAATTFCNVVDVPSLCSFVLPAIARHGPIAIAISTAGASPALAKRMRDEIGAEFGEPYARLALLLNDVRDWAKATLPTYADRREFFEAIVHGDPDPVALLRAGDEEAVRDLIAAAQASHVPV